MFLAKEHEMKLGKSFTASRETANSPLFTLFDQSTSFMVFRKMQESFTKLNKSWKLFLAIKLMMIWNFVPLKVKQFSCFKCKKKREKRRIK